MYDVAIIGTREPDPFQAALATAAAMEISALGHRIRSGGAIGIDTAAQNGCKPGMFDLFLPWLKGYSIKPGDTVTIYDPNIHQKWTESVFKYHPNPLALKPSYIPLHARNYGIVGGTGLVIALPGSIDGGTGQGMRIAQGLNICLLVCRKGLILHPEKWLKRIIQIVKELEAS